MIDQAAAIPYQWRNRKLEVLLVTARSDGSWIAPKGTIEDGEDAAEAAAREALEEAGVEGEVHRRPLGNYVYQKSGGRYHLTVFALKVTDAHPEWDESHQRERCWAPIDDALDMVNSPELAEMLERLSDRLHANA